MNNVRLKMPMQVKDSESGAYKWAYAIYEGAEVMVPIHERRKFQTSRFFVLENKKGQQYHFRIRGNGAYEMDKLGAGRVAQGTMMDGVIPEIVSI